MASESCGVIIFENDKPKQLLENETTNNEWLSDNNKIDNQLSNLRCSIPLNKLGERLNNLIKVRLNLNKEVENNLLIDEFIDNKFTDFNQQQNVTAIENKETECSDNLEKKEDKEIKIENDKLAVNNDKEKKENKNNEEGKLLINENQIKEKRIILEEKNDNLSKKRLLCLFCDRTFVNVSLLQKHTDKYHFVSTVTHKSSTRLPQTAQISCLFCGKIDNTNDYKRLLEHLIKKHGNKYHACAICEKRFRNRELLNSHNLVVHGKNALYECKFLGLYSNCYNEKYQLSNINDSSERIGYDYGNAQKVLPKCSRNKFKFDLTEKRNANANFHLADLNSVLPPPAAQFVYQFDDNFFKCVSLNIQDNLLNYLDGKLCKQISLQSNASCSALINNSSTLRMTKSDITLKAVVPVSSLQMPNGPDAIDYIHHTNSSSIAYKNDRNHYVKYNFRNRKAKPLEDDISKLDICSQLSMKMRQNDKQDFYWRHKVLQLEDLNQILDKRPTFQDLFNESLLFNLSDAEYAVKDCLDSILNNAFEIIDRNLITDKTNLKQIRKYQLRAESKLQPKNIFDFLSNLNLCSYRRPLLNDKNNIKLPLSKQIGLKNVKLTSYEQDLIICSLNELSGEWSRPRIYICAACGLNLPTTRLLEEHKNFIHPTIWATHYEFVGDQDKLASNLNIPGLGRWAELKDKIENNKALVAFTGENSQITSCQDISPIQLDHSAIDKVSIQNDDISKVANNKQSKQIVDKENLYISSSPQKTNNLSNEDTEDEKKTEKSLSNLENYESNIQSNNSNQCKKCHSSFDDIFDFHKHILECGGDWTWLNSKKKYRPYHFRGKSKRRRLKGFRRHFIYRTFNPERTIRRDRHKMLAKVRTPKSKASDAESIQRMLANLPPKRSTRKIICLKDGFSHKSRVLVSHSLNPQIKQECKKLNKAKAASIKIKEELKRNLRCKNLQNKLEQELQKELMNNNQKINDLKGKNKVTQKTGENIEKSIVLLKNNKKLNKRNMNILYKSSTTLNTRKRQKNILYKSRNQIRRGNNVHLLKISKFGRVFKLKNFSKFNFVNFRKRKKLIKRSRFNVKYLRVRLKNKVNIFNFKPKFKFIKKSTNNISQNYNVNEGDVVKTNRKLGIRRDPLNFQMQNDKNSIFDNKLMQNLQLTNIIKEIQNENQSTILSQMEKTVEAVPINQDNNNHDVLLNINIKSVRIEMSQNKNKRKQRKPVKKLNDCIEMLTNKLNQKSIHQNNDNSSTAQYLQFDECPKNSLIDEFTHKPQILSTNFNSSLLKKSYITNCNTSNLENGPTESNEENPLNLTKNKHEIPKMSSFSLNNVSPKGTFVNPLSYTKSLSSTTHNSTSQFINPETILDPRFYNAKHKDYVEKQQHTNYSIQNILNDNQVHDKKSQSSELQPLNANSINFSISQILANQQVNLTSKVNQEKFATIGNQLTKENSKLSGLINDKLLKNKKDSSISAINEFLNVNQLIKFQFDQINKEQQMTLGKDKYSNAKQDYLHQNLNLIGLFNQHGKIKQSQNKECQLNISQTSKDKNLFKDYPFSFIKNLNEQVNNEKNDLINSKLINEINKTYMANKKNSLTNENFLNQINKDHQSGANNLRNIGNKSVFTNQFNKKQNKNLFEPNNRLNKNKSQINLISEQLLRQKMPSNFLLSQQINLANSPFVDNSFYQLKRQKDLSTLLNYSDQQTKSTKTNVSSNNILNKLISSNKDVNSKLFQEENEPKKSKIDNVNKLSHSNDTFNNFSIFNLNVPKWPISNKNANTSIIENNSINETNINGSNNFDSLKTSQVVNKNNLVNDCHIKKYSETTAIKDSSTTKPIESNNILNLAKTTEKNNSEIKTTILNKPLLSNLNYSTNIPNLKDCSNKSLDNKSTVSSVSNKSELLDLSSKKADINHADNKTITPLNNANTTSNATQRFPNLLDDLEELISVKTFVKKVEENLNNAKMPNDKKVDKVNSKEICNKLASFRKKNKIQVSNESKRDDSLKKDEKEKSKRGRKKKQTVSNNESNEETPVKKNIFENVSTGPTRMTRNSMAAATISSLDDINALEDVIKRSDIGQKEKKKKKILPNKEAKKEKTVKTHNVNKTNENINQNEIEVIKSDGNPINLDAKSIKSDDEKKINDNNENHLELTKCLVDDQNNILEINKYDDLSECVKIKNFKNDKNSCSNKKHNITKIKYIFHSKKREFKIKKKKKPIVKNLKHKPEKKIKYKNKSSLINQKNKIQKNVKYSSKKLLISTNKNLSKKRKLVLIHSQMSTTKESNKSRVKSDLNVIFKLNNNDTINESSDEDLPLISFKKYLNNSKIQEHPEIINNENNKNENFKKSIIKNYENELLKVKTDYSENSSSSNVQSKKKNKLNNKKLNKNKKSKKISKQIDSISEINKEIKTNNQNNKINLVENNSESFLSIENTEKNILENEIDQNPENLENKIKQVSEMKTNNEIKTNIQNDKLDLNKTNYESIEITEKNKIEGKIHEEINVLNENTKNLNININLLNQNSNKLNLDSTVIENIKESNIKKPLKLSKKNKNISHKIKTNSEKNSAKAVRKALKKCKSAEFIDSGKVELDINKDFKTNFSKKTINVENIFDSNLFINELKKSETSKMEENTKNSINTTKKTTKGKQIAENFDKLNVEREAKIITETIEKIEDNNFLKNLDINNEDNTEISTNSVKDFEDNNLAEKNNHLIELNTDKLQIKDQNLNSDKSKTKNQKFKNDKLQFKNKKLNAEKIKNQNLKMNKLQIKDQNLNTVKLKNKNLKKINSKILKKRTKVRDSKVKNVDDGIVLNNENILRKEFNLKINEDKIIAGKNIIIDYNLIENSCSLNKPIEESDSKIKNKELIDDSSDEDIPLIKLTSSQNKNNISFLCCENLDQIVNKIDQNNSLSSEINVAKENKAIKDNFELIKNEINEKDQKIISSETLSKVDDVKFLDSNKDNNEQKVKKEKNELDLNINKQNLETNLPKLDEAETLDLNLNDVQKLEEEIKFEIKVNTNKKNVKIMRKIKDRKNKKTIRKDGLKKKLKKYKNNNKAKDLKAKKKLTTNNKCKKSFDSIEFGLSTEKETDVELQKDTLNTIQQKDKLKISKPNIESILNTNSINEIKNSNQTIANKFVEVINNIPKIEEIKSKRKESVKEIVDNLSENKLSKENDYQNKEKELKKPKKIHREKNNIVQLKSKYCLEDDILNPLQTNENFDTLKENETLPHSTENAQKENMLDEKENVTLSTLTKCPSESVEKFMPKTHGKLILKIRSAILDKNSKKKKKKSCRKQLVAEVYEKHDDEISKNNNSTENLSTQLNDYKQLNNNDSVILIENSENNGINEPLINKESNKDQQDSNSFQNNDKIQKKRGRKPKKIKNNLKNKFVAKENDLNTNFKENANLVCEDIINEETNNEDSTEIQNQHNLNKQEICEDVEIVEHFNDIEKQKNIKKIFKTKKNKIKIKVKRPKDKKNSKTLKIYDENEDNLSFVCSSDNNSTKSSLENYQKQDKLSQIIFEQKLNIKNDTNLKEKFNKLEESKEKFDKITSEHLNEYDFTKEKGNNENINFSSKTNKNSNQQNENINLMSMNDENVSSNIFKIQNFNIDNNSKEKDQNETNLIKDVTKSSYDDSNSGSKNIDLKFNLPNLVTNSEEINENENNFGLRRSNRISSNNESVTEEIIDNYSNYLNQKSSFEHFSKQMKKDKNEGKKLTKGAKKVIEEEKELKDPASKNDANNVKMASDKLLIFDSNIDTSNEKDIDQYSFVDEIEESPNSSLSELRKNKILKKMTNLESDFSKNNTSCLLDSVSLENSQVNYKKMFENDINSSTLQNTLHTSCDSENIQDEISPKDNDFNLEKDYFKTKNTETKILGKNKKSKKGFKNNKNKKIEKNIDRYFNPNIDSERKASDSEDDMPLANVIKNVTPKLSEDVIPLKISSKQVILKNDLFNNNDNISYTEENKNKSNDFIDVKIENNKIINDQIDNDDETESKKNKNEFKKNDVSADIEDKNIIEKRTRQKNNIVLENDDKIINKLDDFSNKYLDDKISVKINIKSVKNSNITSKSKILLDNETSQSISLNKGETDIEKKLDYYCEICKKYFCREINFMKHERTLTHVAKLSEIEAQEMEAKREKERLESKKTEIETKVNDLDKNLKELDNEQLDTKIIESNFEQSEYSYESEKNSLLESNKVILEKSLEASQQISEEDLDINYLIENCKFENRNIYSMNVNSLDITNDASLEAFTLKSDATQSDLSKSNLSKRYKSLGERKSFENSSSKKDTKTIEDMQNKGHIQKKEIGEFCDSVSEKNSFEVSKDKNIETDQNCSIFENDSNNSEKSEQIQKDLEMPCKSLGERKSFESNFVFNLKKRKTTEKQIISKKIRKIDVQLDNKNHENNDYLHSKTSQKNAFKDSAEINSCLNFKIANNSKSKINFDSCFNKQRNQDKKCEPLEKTEDKIDIYSFDSDISNTKTDTSLVRKKLNRDEELFIECCSLLKSSSEFRPELNHHPVHLQNQHNNLVQNRLLQTIQQNDLSNQKIDNNLTKSENLHEKLLQDQHIDVKSDKNDFMDDEQLSKKHYSKEDSDIFEKRSFKQLTNEFSPIFKQPNFEYDQNEYEQFDFDNFDDLPNIPKSYTTVDNVDTQEDFALQNKKIDELSHYSNSRHNSSCCEQDDNCCDEKDVCSNVSSCSLKSNHISSRSSYYSSHEENICSINNGDSLKVRTKAAMKIFEGIKVSIPLEKINLDKILREDSKGSQEIYDQNISSTSDIFKQTKNIYELNNEVEWLSNSKEMRPIKHHKKNKKSKSNKNNKNKERCFKKNDASKKRDDSSQIIAFIELNDSNCSNDSFSNDNELRKNKQNLNKLNDVYEFNDSDSEDVKNISLESKSKELDQQEYEASEMKANWNTEIKNQKTNINKYKMNYANLSNYGNFYENRESRMFQINEDDPYVNRQNSQLIYETNRLFKSIQDRISASQPNDIHNLVPANNYSSSEETNQHAYIESLSYDEYSDSLVDANQNQNSAQPVKKRRGRKKKLTKKKSQKTINSRENYKKRMIMGRIFRHAVKNPSESDPERKNMNQLFDMLLEKKSQKNSLKSNEEMVNKKLENEINVKSGRKKKTTKRRKGTYFSSDEDFNLNNCKKSRKKKKEDTSSSINIEQELNECIGVASRKSQRTCTSGKQNVLVEYWSSDDISESENSKRILENSKIIRRKKKKKISKSRNSDIENKLNNNKLNLSLNKQNNSQFASNNDLDFSSNKFPEENKSFTSNSSKNRMESSYQEDIDKINQININDMTNDNTNSESKEKTENEEEIKSDLNISKTISNESLALRRNKRKAVEEQLYYWSSSSDEGYSKNYNSHNDELEKEIFIDDEDEERPVQHGWIVGESPKKLVTMLAQAKGSKKFDGFAHPSMMLKKKTKQKKMQKS